MALPRLSWLKQLIPRSTSRNLNTLSEELTHTLSLYSRLNRRTYHYRPSFDTGGLHSKITLFAAGSPDSSIIPFIDQWILQGNQIRGSELHRIIRTFRSKKRFVQALEVSEWMTKSCGQFSAGDCAVQLDLIGKVRGITAAVNYFNEIGDHSEHMYGALLNCYVREGLIHESFRHLSLMENLGLTKHTLTYNGIMSLYINDKQLEKVPEVLSRMLENGVSPDNVSYRMCIKSYGLRSDFSSMEKLLQEMENQPHITIEWSTYTTVSSHYIQGGLHERAVHYLRKAEEKVHKKAVGYNHLITMYASLGNVSEMTRLWESKSTCTKHINIDYMTMIASLVKLGEFQEAERLFLEWESSGNLYDLRVPNTLLIGYTQQGQVEKAERMLESIISKGHTPIPNSWSIITSGYIGIPNMEKAVGCMKKALELGPQHRGWEPKPALVSTILEWLADNGDIKDVEEFARLLGGVVTKDREMYHDLLKAKVEHRKEINGVLHSLKADSIDVDEETEKLRSCR